MKMQRFYLGAATGLALTLGLTVMAGQPAYAAETTYTAKLVPMNAKITGSEAGGEARFTISGDTLTITVDAHGLPPGMSHMQHLHGFIDGKNATCPGTAADVNHDGVVDLNETEAAAGTTLIPLNADPVALKLAGAGYPTASKDGTYSYRQSVSLKALDAAMAKTYKGASADLAKRVIFLHGVPEHTALPKTAASLPGVPAQMTLPIACGKLVPAK
jgi:hypothetical protein